MMMIRWMMIRRNATRFGYDTNYPLRKSDDRNESLDLHCTASDTIIETISPCDDS